MQEIKSSVKVADNLMQYEVFDVGSKAFNLSDEEEQNMYQAIDELGLKGQRDLIKDQANKIIPYPKMTTQEERVWKEFCPQRDKLEDFSNQVIPYEIIGVLSLIKTKKLFDINQNNGKVKKTGWIEVWSEGTKVIDPIVVGVINTSTKYDWGWASGNEDFYLIARWGQALKKYEEIVEIAKNKWRENVGATANKKLKEAQRILSQLDEDCVDYFNGGNPNVNIF